MSSSQQLSLWCCVTHVLLMLPVLLLLLLQGIELYKDNLALNERITTYYAAVQVLPALKWVTQLSVSCSVGHWAARLPRALQGV
jgi:hypothetical protein